MAILNGSGSRRATTSVEIQIQGGIVFDVALTVAAATIRWALQY
jgi:hypothetical protein